MPLSYRIDTRAGIVTIGGDYADASAWRELLRAVAADADYRRGFSFLRDLRESAHPVDAQTVVGIIAVVREFWRELGGHRAAIVTRRGIDDPAVMAHALAEVENIPLRTFTSFDDAIGWLCGGRPAGDRGDVL